MIRIGSCGASKSYIEPIYPAIPDTRLLMATIQAAEEQKFPFYIGPARSHDSFYTDREEEIDAYWSKRGILGADMETAALFTIGALRGVKCASILNTVVEFEDDLEKNINDYVDGESIVKQGEAHEIITALEAFVIENKVNGGKGYEQKREEFMVTQF